MSLCGGGFVCIIRNDIMFRLDSGLFLFFSCVFCLFCFFSVFSSVPSSLSALCHSLPTILTFHCTGLKLYRLKHWTSWSETTTVSRFRRRTCEPVSVLVAGTRCSVAAQSQIIPVRVLDGIGALRSGPLSDSYRDQQLCEF